MNYKIVDADDPRDLEVYVSRLLANGWELSGGVSITFRYRYKGNGTVAYRFAQALVSNAPAASRAPCSGAMPSAYGESHAPRQDDAYASRSCDVCGRKTATVPIDFKNHFGGNPTTFRHYICAGCVPRP